MLDANPDRTDLELRLGEAAHVAAPDSCESFRSTLSRPSLNHRSDYLLLLFDRGGVQKRRESKINENTFRVPTTIFA
jgi:hypothetical protein